MIREILAVKWQHFESFKFGILKVLMVENINTVNTKKIQIQMLHKMGVLFFLMTPFNKTSRLCGLLPCFLSALQFQSWTIGTKAKKRQKRQPLLHFTIILICKEKKKVKDFSEIIKINKKLSIKTLKTWALFLNNYYWIYFFGFWDKRWINLEHPFYRTVSSEYLC